MSLARYSLLRRGKKLIKSATTVTNRGKPKNVRSRAAKSHRNGKWLWCTKKPRQTEDHVTECTHHQRAYILNAKLTMFGEGQKEHSLLISMDDKAYLRPGTDVGVRDTKAGVIYDVCEPEKQKQLPQHDFNLAEVNQTPASFRFIQQHTEKIEEKEELISNQDQSVVIIRPKHYIGSCGSVWASDYMRLSHELPMLFQEASSGNIDYSIEFRKLVTFSHDVVFYFVDLTMKEDVICATPQTGCQHYCYENEKLVWFKNQLDKIMGIWTEDKERVKESEETLANELLEKLISIKENTASLQRNMLFFVKQEKLWNSMEDLLSEFSQYLRKIDCLNPPRMSCSILTTTDAGPGVGITNTEVRFRDAEVARIHSSDRVNRIQRAPGDSAQNEAERTNAAIGDALVDGSALRWEYFKPFDGLTVEEIDALSASEVKQKERDCMEKNAWQVAQEVAAMVDDEPGPSGDFVKCYGTTCKKDQFFFNKKYLMQYTAAKTEAKRRQVPGCSYFKKMYSFIDTHFQIGEMFLEYQRRDCEISSGKLCDFCKSSEKCCSQTERIPRPFPDYQSPGLHYLPVHMTSTVNRTIDDYLPRAQLRKAYQSGECSLEDLDSISKFAQEFVVSEECVKTYLEHLKLLELKKVKRKKERLEKSSVRAKVTY